MNAGDISTRFNVAFSRFLFNIFLLPFACMYVYVCVFYLAPSEGGEPFISKYKIEKIALT